MDGTAQEIYYDIAALNPIVYILECRIGPCIKRYVKKVHALGGKVYANPDGIQDIMWLNQKTPCKYRVLAAWLDSLKVLFPTGQKSAPAKIWWISSGRMVYTFEE